MSDIEALRKQFEREDKSAAAHQARLRTLATQRQLGLQAWESLMSGLAPEAQIRLRQTDGAILSNTEGGNYAGKPLGTKRGAL